MKGFTVIIKKETKFLGVFGSPVGHSKSPLLFNSLFQHYGVDAVYRYIDSKDVKGVLSSVKSLNYLGLSVTIPHKEEAMKYVDVVDDFAMQLGCINTVINENGVLKGYNFDGIGAGEALFKHDTNWSGKNILILGAGGAARGIALSFVLKYGVKKLYFLVRNKKDNALIKDLLSHCEVVTYSYEEVDELFHSNAIDIIINTTPVGMSPHENETPLSAKYLSSKRVFDIIYTPKMTRLLKDSESVGSQLVFGYEMFLDQAFKQFELWFGFCPDRQVMEDILFKTAKE